MIDLVQLQKDIYALLMSAPALSTVNIVMERKFMVDATIELDAIWQTPRNDRSGNGLLVEIPTAKVMAANIQDMPQDISVTLVAFQNGDAAFTPETGGGHFAENLAQLALAELHLQPIIGLGTLAGVGHEPAKDYEFINAERATLRISGVRTPAVPRCAAIQFTNYLNTVQLTCATPGAEIYFTLDGSSPVNPALTDPLGAVINPNSFTYTTPVPVSSGQRVRAVAQAFGYRASEIINQLIP